MAKETSQLEIVISAKDEASKALGNIGDKLGSISKISGIAGGAILGALGFMAKGAMEAEESNARVTATLTAMGKEALKNKDAIQAAAEETVKKGFDDEAAAESITRLYKLTGDHTKAIDLNKIAMGLARSKGISLSDASEKVAMAVQGGTKAFKDMGIQVDETKTPFENLIAYSAEAEEQINNFAATPQGNMLALKESFSNISDAVATNLLPKITELLDKITPVIEKVGKWVEENPKLVDTMVKVVAAVGLVLMAISVLSPIFTVITTAVALFGTALAFIAANPIVLVIAAIAALVAGIVWLIKNWDDVSAKVKEVWGIITTWIKTKTDEIKANISEWGEGVKTSIVNTWTSVKKTMEDIWNGIKNTVKGAIDSIISSIQQMINKLKELASMGGSGGGFISSAVKAVSPTLGAIGGIISAVSGKKAGGGIVNAGSSYLVGEKGPELFTPSNTGRITPNGGVGGGLTIIIQGNSFMGEQDMAVKVGDMIVNKLKLQAKLSI